MSSSESSSPIEPGETPPSGDVEPQTCQINTPADKVAGGPKDKGQGGQHCQAVQNIVKLEVIKRMYARLLKLEVGTGMIESEAMKMVWERTSGPTGHGSLMLLDQVENKKHCQDVGELLRESVNSTVNCCWRDRGLIRKLVQMRLNTITPQWKKAKTVLTQVMRDMAMTATKEEVKQAWTEVLETRKKIWDQENPVHQRKIEFLHAKAKDCSKHARCKDLNKLVVERIARWTAGKQQQQQQQGDQLPQEQSEEPSHPPRLDPVWKTKDEDLKGLTVEETTLNSMLKKFCQDLKPEEEGNIDEVVTYGNVNLNEDEKSLLNLGPNFMVLGDLDPIEMQVEATVTLTKIRWSRMSRGVEKMTERQIEKEELDLGLQEMVEEERLADALNAEARDVISPDFKAVNMGQKRATDMKNNRDVKMPGPAPPPPL